MQFAVPFVHISVYKCAGQLPSRVAFTTVLNPAPHSQMVALPYLPQETIAGIIGLLTEDTQSLRSCSLDSTDWIHRARIRLFTSANCAPSTTNLSQEYEAQPIRSFLRLEDKSRWITPNTLQVISTSCPNFVDSRRFDTELGRAPLRLHVSENGQPHARQPYNGESLDIPPKSRHLSSLMRQVDPFENQRQLCAVYDCSICASFTYYGSQRGAVKDCGFRILQPLKDLLAAYHQMVNVVEVSYTCKSYLCGQLRRRSCDCKIFHF